MSETVTGNTASATLRKMRNMMSDFPHMTLSDAGFIAHADDAVFDALSASCMLCEKSWEGVTAYANEVGRTREELLTWLDNAVKFAEAAR